MVNLPLHAYFDIVGCSNLIGTTFVDGEISEEVLVTVSLRACEGTPIQVKNGNPLEMYEFSIVSSSKSRTHTDLGIEAGLLGSVTLTQNEDGGGCIIAGQFLANHERMTWQSLMLAPKKKMLMVFRNVPAIQIGQKYFSWEPGRNNSIEIESINFEFSS